MTVKERTPLTVHLAALTSLSADEGIVLADGTLWSHAASLGTRTKSDEFTIDRATVENFVRVFTSGYPQKIPVDYDHASTSQDPEVRKLRAQGLVPKAGDVAELRGVFAASDFAGDLKTTVEKLSAKAGRSLEDPRNFGLWMRWKPTARALAAVKAGDFSELSIAFGSDIPNNTNGDGQGPGILAVGLVLRPFLDDMLSVAASADDSRSPADPAPREGTMTINIKLLSAIAALAAKPVNTDDEGTEQLTALQVEIPKLRDYSSVVSAELGETDPVRAAAKIRELKATAQTAKDEAATQKKKAIETTVETTMKQYEGSLTVPLKKILSANLTRELEAGTELDKTETVGTLKTLPKNPAFTQDAGGDLGGGNKGASEDKVEARAKELMNANAEIKQLNTDKGFGPAWREAWSMAEKEFAAAAK